MGESTWRTLVSHLAEASDEELTADQMTPATSLREDLDLSSLQAITLVMDLEEQLGIQVEDDELEQLETVGDLAELIDGKLESKPAGEA